MSAPATQERATGRGGRAWNAAARISSFEKKPGERRHARERERADQERDGR